jgi:hypothetical protein
MGTCYIADRYTWPVSEEAEAPAPKPKRRRRPVDWTLLFMIFGTLAFLVFFAALTLMAPRRPFLILRAVPGFGGASAPAAVETKPAGKPGEKPAEAKPGEVKPGDAKPADAKPADAKPAEKPATK